MPQILILAKSISEANAYAKLAGLPRFSYRPVQKAGSIRGVRNAEVHKLTSFDRRPDRHAILGALRHARTLTIIEIDYDAMREQIHRLGELTVAQLEEAHQINDLGYPDEAELEMAYDFNENVFPHLEAPGWTPPDTLEEALATSTATPCLDIPATVALVRETNPDLADVLVAGGGLQLTEDEVTKLAGEEPERVVQPDEVEVVAKLADMAVTPELTIEEPAPKRRRTRCKTCSQLHFSDEPCPAPAPESFFGGA